MSDELRTKSGMKNSTNRKFVEVRPNVYVTYRLDMGTSYRSFKTRKELEDFITTEEAIELINYNDGYFLTRITYEVLERVRWPLEKKP